MDDKTRKVIEKVKAVIRQAEGEREVGNFAAADNILAMAQDMLRRHKLDMTALDLETEDVQNPIGESMYDPHEHGLPKTNMLLEWQHFLAAAVAEAHFCTVLGWSNTNIMLFIGREGDREIAVYLYVFLVRTAVRFGEQEWRQHHAAEMWWMGRDDLMYEMRREEYLNSFYFGFAQQVQARYAERGVAYRRAEGWEPEPADGPTGPAGGEASAALVRLSDAMSRVVAYTLRLTGGVQTDISAAGRQHEAGFERGREHGRRVRLEANVMTEGEEPPERKELEG